MSVYRSYFLKNNTLIEGNPLSNTSQNPVGEISYGTVDHSVSRIIFNVDLSLLQQKIINEGLTVNQIGTHTLVLTNTVSSSHLPQNSGFSYSPEIIRASSFNLELFTLLEDWDEGNGYEFQYLGSDTITGLQPTGASNWNEKKTTIDWAVPGAFIPSGTTGLTGITGVSKILAVQNFPKGNENVTIDITPFINAILFSGATQHGFGLKMQDALEALDTTFRYAVAFHLKNTNTCFDPYVETQFNDNIQDDRNHVYLDKDSDLYLYSDRGDVTITGVTIIDYNGNNFTTIPASGVTKVKKGVYKVTVNIPSATYPDEVLFSDIWGVVQNSKNKKINNRFFLVDSNVFYSFGMSNRLNPNNYHFSYYGLNSGEFLKRGDIRRIVVTIKQLYQNIDSSVPLDIQYRLCTKQSNNVQIDIIPFTQVDRTALGYEFNLDTSWLLPQDYHMELKISDGAVFNIKSPIGFTIVSDDAFTGV